MTNTEHGEFQLKLLTDQLRQDAFMKAMLKGAKPRDFHATIENDGFAPDNRPILVCCLLDIPKFVIFQTGLSLLETKMQSMEDAFNHAFHAIFISSFVM